MSNFEVVMGIEIHLALNTKTKMFSPAPIVDGGEPNTFVSPIDMGYPGTLPVVNKQGVIKAIKLAKALNMKIDNHLHFDRKNYFYTDLPKGFQITQFFRPIGSNGFIPLSNGKKVEIERIHIEEDTAKSQHIGNKTQLDYNRAGTPLVEIVTEPVIRSAKEAAEYVNAIRQLALSLGISDAKMEEGNLRADINISIRPYGQKEFGTRIEIKNLNSINNIHKGIEFEVQEQIRKVMTGEKVVQATKRFDEATQKTVMMREKGDAVDYRYFPDPNIPIIELEQSFIDDVTINELPWERRKRYQEWKLEDDYIEKLSADLEKATWFDQIKFDDKSQLVKIFFAEVVALANSENKTINELEIDIDEFVKTLTYLGTGKISGSHIKKIIPLLSTTNKGVDQIIKDEGMEQISDKNQISEIIEKIIKDNADFINKNSDRSERVEKFVLGQLMKQTKGQANPVVSSQIVKEKLK